MKLALLGADAESLKLADAAAALGHELSWQGDLAGADPAGHPWLAGADQSDHWEDLFDENVADAIIVGRGAMEDLRARQVQDLARLGRPMIAVHPLFESVLTYFEVDMARGESQAIVVHFNPLVESPLLAEAAQWIRSGHPRLGKVEQIVATRHLANRSVENVLWHFARDVEMLARVAGRLDRIGAHAAPGAAAAYSALSVQLMGSLEIPVRWLVEPPPEAHELRLTLMGNQGRITIVFDASDHACKLIEQIEGEESTSTSPPFDPAAAAIQRFVDAVAVQRPDAATWPAALDAMELADSIEISLRRGRMIDVHHQQLTEHLAFKGTMAAAGCAVLVVLVPLMLVIGLIAGQFGVPVASFLPHALLFLLAAFLGLQLLPKLLYRTPDVKKPSDA